MAHESSQNHRRQMKGAVGSKPVTQGLWHTVIAEAKLRSESTENMIDSIVVPRLSGVAAEHWTRAVGGNHGGHNLLGARRQINDSLFLGNPSRLGRHDDNTLSHVYMFDFHPIGLAWPAAGLPHEFDHVSHWVILGCGEDLGNRRRIEGGLPLLVPRPHEISERIIEHERRLVLHAPTVLPAQDFDHGLLGRWRPVSFAFFLPSKIDTRKPALNVFVRDRRCQPLTPDKFHPRTHVESVALIMSSRMPVLGPRQKIVSQRPDGYRRRVPSWWPVDRGHQLVKCFDRLCAILLSFGQRVLLAFDLHYPCLRVFAKPWFVRSTHIVSAPPVKRPISDLPVS